MNEFMSIIIIVRRYRTKKEGIKIRTNVTGKAEYQKRREAWEDKFLRLFAPSLIGKVPNLRAWDSMAFFDFE